MIAALRTCVLGVGGLVLLVGGGLAAFALSQDPDALLIEAAATLKAETGITVQTGSGASWTFSPLPGIETGPITVTHPEGAFRIAAKRAEIGIDLMGLLQGNRALGAVVFDEAAVDVSHDAAGVLDLNGPSPSFGRATIGLRRTALTIIGLANGAETLQISTATIETFGRKAPIALHGEATWRQRSVSIAATLDNPFLLSQGGMARVDVDIAVATGDDRDPDRATYSGSIGLPKSARMPFAEGRAKLIAADPASTLAWMGIDANVRALAAIDLAAEIKALPKQLWISLTGTGLVQGKSASAGLTIGGGLGWHAGAPWQIDAVSRAGGLYSVYVSGVYDGIETVSGTVEAAVLDPAGVTDLAQATVPGTPLRWDHVAVKGKLFARLDQVMLSSTRVALGDHVLTGTLIADMSGPDTIFALRDMASGIGAVAAEVILKPDGTMAGSVNGQDINLAALSEGMNGPDLAGLLSGQARFRIDKAGQDSKDGTPPLTAQAAISIDRGRLPLPDLARISMAEVRSSAPDRDPGTPFETLTGTLVITEDSMRMADLTMRLGDESLTGVAEADLVSDSISARLVPEPTGQNARGILIGGTLTSPVARLELAGLQPAAPARAPDEPVQTQVGPDAQQSAAKPRVDARPQSPQAASAEPLDASEPADDAQETKYRTVPVPVPVPRPARR